MFYLMLLLFVGLPLSLLLLYAVNPRPLFAWADKKLEKALDVDNYNRRSAYAHHGFQPIHAELAPVELQVSGDLPKDLAGSYIRNGTNLQFRTTHSRYHMFNGAGMLHQVQIRDGKATYSNTYVRTPRYREEDSRGEEVYAQFGDLAGGGKAGLARLALEALKKRRGLIADLPMLESGSATTAIQFHNGRLYCLQETGFPFALNTRVENGQLLLDGSGEWETFSGKLGFPFTAHPKVDPHTGDFYSFSTELQSGNIYHAVVSAGKLAKYEQIHHQKPALAFLHDYYLTENYLVFPDLSLRFDPKNMMGPEKSPMVFDPGYKMRFGVIRKDHQAGDPVRWFSTDQPGHFWHAINGWEERRADGGTDIVMFAPVFRSYPSNIPIHNPEEPHACLNKWRLNIESGEVTEDRKLLEHFYERPSFNLAYLGRQNRYAYLLDEEREGIMAKGVLKYDLVAEKEMGYFDYGDYYGGEALFVPRPNSTAEDDGYLIDLLMAEDKAHLLVLDAATLQEVARLHIPQRVPFGVHACWLDSAKIAALA